MCAAHQPQQVGRTERLRFQRVPRRRRGRCGWSSTDTAALLGGRLCRAVLRLCKVPVFREDFPAARSPADDQRIVAKASLFVPEGLRRKLAGGKPAQRARPPDCAAEPTMPQRGIEEVFGGILPAAFPPALVASGHFLRCPVGARRHAARYPGAASAGADLPPANLLRRPSGTRTRRPSPQHVRRAEGVRIFRRRPVPPSA